LDEALAEVHFRYCGEFRAARANSGNVLPLFGCNAVIFADSAEIAAIGFRYLSRTSDLPLNSGKPFPLICTFDTLNVKGVAK